MCTFSKKKKKKNEAFYSKN